MAGTPSNVNVTDYYPRTDAVLGVVAGINLVTAANYFVFKALPRPALVKFVLFENFSAFPQNTPLPSTIALTYGTDATFSNMGTISFSTQVAPFVFAQQLSLIPYCTVGQSLTLALTVGVAASGTCQATFIGTWL